MPHFAPAELRGATLRQRLANRSLGEGWRFNAHPSREHLGTRL